MALPGIEESSYLGSTRGMQRTYHMVVVGVRGHVPRVEGRQRARHHHEAVGGRLSGLVVEDAADLVAGAVPPHPPPPQTWFGAAVHS